MTKKQRALKIIAVLEELYPDARCTLNYKTPHELLVAVILASQCTDKRVNEVTKTLFDKYPSPQSFASADFEELKRDIYSTGFYTNKARGIINSSKKIVSDFDGNIPDTIEELITLDGVGRKIANLIIGEVYNKPAVIVDTHMKRITKRMGLTASDNPTIIERDLRKILPPEKINSF